MDSVTPPENGALNALLASYASGGLDPALHALVASHLAINSRNRRFVTMLELHLGSRLSQVPPSTIDRREARLEAIFAQTPPPPALSQAPSGPEADLPAPLRRYMRVNGDKLRWRFLLPGIRQCRLTPGKSGGAANLYRVKPGFAMPTHTHDGLEATLVLTGGFSDVTGHYRRGDIALADADIDHRPVADADETCLCFIVHESGIRLTGPIGRLIERLFGARRTDRKP